MIGGDSKLVLTRTHTHVFPHTHTHTHNSYLETQREREREITHLAKWGLGSRKRKNHLVIFSPVLTSAEKFTTY